MADVAAVATGVTVFATDSDFPPQVITVKQGEPVTLVLVNDGPIEHDLDVAALGLHLHAPAGATTRGSFLPGRVGTFDLTCGVPGQNYSSMLGSMVVTD